MPQKAGIVSKSRRKVSPKDASISLELESSLKRELEKIARSEDRSISHLVREALRQYVQRRTQVLV